MKSPTSKLCGDCKKVKRLDQFGNRFSRTGSQVKNTFCKKCMSVRMKTWRNKNVKRFRLYQAKYQREHYKHKNLNNGTN